MKDLSALTWTFEKLREWFISNKVDPSGVFKSIHKVSRLKKCSTKLSCQWQAVTSVLLASELRFHQHFVENLPDRCRGCYQLLGIDLILDDAYTPTVIEVLSKTRHRVL